MATPWAHFTSSALISSRGRVWTTAFLERSRLRFVWVASVPIAPGATTTLPSNTALDSSESTFLKSWRLVVCRAAWMTRVCWSAFACSTPRKRPSSSTSVPSALRMAVESVRDFPPVRESTVEWTREFRSSWNVTRPVWAMLPVSSSTRT